MAQTVSELEKEREQLLKAIESQAQSMSTNREGGQEHTLQDWLNAAEEVMPNSPKTRVPPSQSSNTSAAPSAKANQAKNNRASFFGVIIMLALLLTILGVLYIAYMSIHKEIKSVMTSKDTLSQEIKKLKDSVTKLQTADAASGKGQLFEAMQKRVAELEKQVTSLKAESADLKAGLAKQGGAPVATSQLPNNVVTTEVLDAKLKEYTSGIDAKLEKILKHLNLKMDDTTSMEKSPSKPEATQSQVTVSKEEETIAEPKAPDVKPIDQPVVRLVQKAPKPTQPEQPKTPAQPLQNYTQDVKWLMEQPAFNYTLQLASMKDRGSVQQMIDNKQLHGTKIIPQSRSGQKNFVLITGSYASRKEAENAARTYQSNFKISPWIRKIKDLSSRVK